MSSFKRSDPHALRNLTTRVVMTLLTAVVIVWFLPRSTSVHYRYDVGKPWTGGSLIAKFQFPIYKSDEALQAERDSIEANFMSYYIHREDVESKAIEEFAADMEGRMPDARETYRNIIIQELHKIYVKGIIDDDTYARARQDTTLSVRVVRRKNAIPTLITDMYTPKMAYQQLFSHPLMSAGKSVVQTMNLNRYLKPNVIYDKQRSEAELSDLLGSIAESDGMVMAGQKIVDRGEIVDSQTARILLSLEKEQQRQKADNTEELHRVAGQAVLVLLLLVMLGIYLTLFRNDYYEKPRTLLLVYVLTVAFPLIVSLMMRHMFLNVYMLPFAMVPMFIRMFLDSRTAFMVHLIIVLLCALAVKYQYEFIIVQLVAGMTAIYSLREVSKRSQVFRTAVLVTIVSLVVYYVLQVVQIGDSSTDDKSMYIFFIINGMLLLLTYPMMYVIEKAFGFTSDVTLIELSDTNKDLLRQLSEVAPGTFQHSVMVGNLASEIANRIGGKGLLARTGALYHDIGKISNPAFFTENQSGQNPHANLSEKQSARIILDHVSEGIRMAERNHLPNIIKDFIRTHHGKGVAKYFYINYKNNHPDEEVDIQQFAYPGPNPSTKEQAILMMADAVEAASRSLNDYTVEKITELVENIVAGQINEGFFTDCPVTFHDISIAKQTLIERLKTIYHARIAYPELKT